jgi:hypothetical protein
MDGGAQSRPGTSEQRETCQYMIQRKQVLPTNRHSVYSKLICKTGSASQISLAKQIVTTAFQVLTTSTFTRRFILALRCCGHGLLVVGPLTSAQPWLKHYQDSVSHSVSTALLH